MFVQGVTEYDKQGREVKTGILAGAAIRDAELRSTKNGKVFSTVTVKAYSHKDGTATFINLKAWNGKASTLSPVKKGDGILAAGRLDSREYNGKVYVDMDADFLFCMAKESHEIQLSNDSCPGSSGDFQEMDEEDGELPF